MLLNCFFVLYRGVGYEAMQAAKWPACLLVVKQLAEDVPRDLEAAIKLCIYLSLLTGGFPFSSLSPHCLPVPVQPLQTDPGG